MRAERRRSWSPERKREIVAESLEAGCRPGAVAQRYGISTGQLYTWRREILGVQRALTRCEPPRFAAVTLASRVDGAAGTSPEPTLPLAPVRPVGLIEILLPDGVSVRVDAEVDARALRRVLAALEAQ